MHPDWLTAHGNSSSNDNKKLTVHSTLNLASQYIHPVMMLVVFTVEISKDILSIDIVGPEEAPVVLAHL